jgi:hypothetical protein
MNEYCSHCHYKFEKEPGYFFGAMYVNYGLTVAQSIATYGIAPLSFRKGLFEIIPIIAFVIIALASFNIRLSRLLWIYMFKNIRCKNRYLCFLNYYHEVLCIALLIMYSAGVRIKEK